MAGVKKDAFQNWGAGFGDYGNLGSNAASIYGPLQSELASQAAHPMGYTPSQVAAQNTAAQQSAGGSMAGAVGQGALQAARTRNAGAAQNAIQQAGRNTGQTLSNAAVGTEVRNADLQQQQRDQALRGEQSLYNTELGGSQNALGLSNQSLNVANQAKPGFWQQFAEKATTPFLNMAFGA